MSAGVVTKLGNADFIRNIRGTLEDGEHLWICSFPEDPKTDGKWYGGLVSPGRRLDLPPEHNNYFSVAVLRGGRRKAANFTRMMVLVADDADRAKLKCEPSWVLRTSQGKAQIGFILDQEDPAVRDPDQCRAALQELTDHGLVAADTSGNNLVRYVRLPIGTNTKGDYPAPFPHELLEWRPDVRVTLAEAIEAFGVSALDREDRIPRAAASPPGTGSPELGLFKSALSVLDPDMAYDDWLHVGMALHHEMGGSEEGFAAWDAWSSRGEKYVSREDLETRWASFGSSAGVPVTGGTIKRMAAERGWSEPHDEIAKLFDVVELSDVQKAEEEAVRQRNVAKADRIAKAVIAKAQAQAISPTDVMALIECNGFIECLPPAQLASKVIGELVKAQLGCIDEEVVLKALKDETGFSLKSLRSDLAQARRRGPGDEHSAVSTDWPVPTARAFLAEKYTRGGELTLRHWQDEFLGWDGIRYRALGSADVRAELYKLYERHHVELPGRGPVDNALDALKALTNVSMSQGMPCWLTALPPAPADELIAVRNGLLHLKTRELLPHDPRFFSQGAVSVDYDRQAPKPVHWLKFLDDAFPDDQESIDCLQQWFGYLLTQDTSQQKALICVGPKRCGKGTIARVLRALLGDHNFAGPTLGQLSRQFGLQGLIGKSLAVISDARVSGAADLQAISETLLRITGEDAISVERKGIADWVGRLPTRFVLMTNILPGIVDAGGAIASRFIVLRFTRSFFGQEDLRLTDKLLDELPGILNWALHGLAQLEQAGAFLQPASGRDAVDELIRRTTPILGFISDVLESAPDAWVLKDQLYACYRHWCEEEGQRFVASKTAFFTELYANGDGRIKAFAPRKDGRPQKAVAGVRFSADWAVRLSDF